MHLVIQDAYQDARCISHTHTPFSVGGILSPSMKWLFCQTDSHLATERSFYQHLYCDTQRASQVTESQFHMIGCNDENRSIQSGSRLAMCWVLHLHSAHGSCWKVISIFCTLSICQHVIKVLFIRVDHPLPKQETSDVISCLPTLRTVFSL